MSRPFKLRPYQKAAVASAVARYKANERRMLLYLPTGAGKTVIATHIIQALRDGFGLGRALFVAHRREILDQTVRTLQQHLPALRIEVEQGERSAEGDADVTVASVQSLLRRKDRYDPKAFDLIICDECHRALAPSWDQVISYFWSQAGERTVLLGMTATPRRSDGRSVLEFFGEAAFEISRTDLEDLGYLVPMQYFTVQGDLKLDQVQQSGGDFQVAALSRVMDSPVHRALAVKAWLEQGAGKKTLVFCAGVEHARHLADDFRGIGVRAEMIDGKTKEREQLLQRFQSGELQVLTNYGVLTEGFDEPSVTCILMARPTTSPLVYTQCIGRGLRCSPGKSSCTIIDLVDRSTHQLQYDANQMAGLPPRWRSRGSDPFRQARSLRGIKVTTPEAFLQIKQAQSLEEVHTILMSLPPSVVVAGLDGEPVLRYEASDEVCGAQAAEARAGHLLRQAGARGARVAVDEESVRITFKNPEVDNERFGFLKWHLSRVTRRVVEFDANGQKQKKLNPRAVLRSMLPERCRIDALEKGPAGEMMVATIAGLLPGELAAVASEFQLECGVRLDLRGQMSLF
ncbi:MAG TPA: DEAD/DEAH box helicase [Polyangiaceae bacterium]|nr:DEAD/DEAH box helicase [Polyangiaceae bacterium]